MRLRDYQLNLALAVVREMRRTIPNALARAVIIATSDWTCQALRAGALATVTRIEGRDWRLTKPDVPPFLTYRPDREGD